MATGTLITTVVVAATAASGGGAYDLTTLAVVKDELKKTDGSSDATLRRFITSASLAVKQYCNRVFQVETVLDEFWPLRDPYPSLMRGGLAPLQLSRFPIVSVASAVENAVTLTVTTDYRIDPAKGQLVRLDSNGFPRHWPTFALAVQYSAGFATIPSDVADAVVRMVKQRWFARGTDTSIKHENIPGVREYDRWVSTGDEAGNMPPDVVDILDNYRVPVTA